VLRGEIVAGGATDEGAVAEAAIQGPEVAILGPADHLEPREDPVHLQDTDQAADIPAREIRQEVAELRRPTCRHFQKPPAN
jgi:hypothetical protein